jgi:aspartate-semialdehyde dehydrogenase
VADLAVVACDPTCAPAPVVFSALDADAAREIEPAFARAGAVVLSNAKSYRMEPDVPLVIPEINAAHLDLLSAQRAARGWSGALVTNPNCSTAVLALALAPLHEAFGVRGAFVATMQAVSGAGYPGVPSLDILGNVIPHIGGEEEKVESEPLKILGRIEGTAIRAASIAISAHTNRVPVEHGHTVCVSAALDRRASVGEAAAAISEWRGDPAARGLPTSPPVPVLLTTAADRPQPRRDVMLGAGMTVTVGRLRPDPVLHLRLVAMGHNTVRGAAGASLLNAELMAVRGLLPEP